jgi:flagellar hook-associated protein 2
MDLGVSGLASGFDWRSLVDQLSEVERLPQQRLRAEQGTLEQRNTAYGAIRTQFNVLLNRLNSLQATDLYESRKATSGDTTTASASAGSAAVTGTHTFQFQQLATASRWTGSADAGNRLNTTADVSGLALADAAWKAPITTGTFRVNGAAVTVEAGDTLQGLFDKISDATDGEVTGTYDPTTDRIRLESDGAIVLGSATDTSNFLSLARLHNNGTGDISSAGSLGTVQGSAVLAEANLATAIAPGSGGTGMFRINGVEIAWTESDTMDAVLQRINASAAGVTASYDAVQDRFQLVNRSTGDLGMGLEDVEGNFLAATGMTGGSLQRGTDLLYTIDGGDVLRSGSNTVTAASSGLNGWSVTALKDNASVAVTVGASTDKVRDAIKGFIDDYNRLQSKIAAETGSSTNAEGQVTTNTLTGESDAESWASALRRMAFSPANGLEGGLKHLEAMGISTSGDNDQLKITDEARLEEVLATRLTEVKDLFTHSSEGLAVKMAAFVEKLAGDGGLVETKQNTLTRQRGAIDQQVADLERVVQSNRDRMMDAFVSMERTQATLNQQLQFLMQRFGS